MATISTGYLHSEGRLILERGGAGIAAPEARRGWWLAGRCSDWFESLLSDELSAESLSPENKSERAGTVLSQRDALQKQSPLLCSAARTISEITTDRVGNCVTE